MSQLSRPYQLALAAVLVFAVAWFAVLRQHTAASTATSSPAVASTPSSRSESTAAVQEKAAAKHTSAVIDPSKAAGSAAKTSSGSVAKTSPGSVAKTSSGSVAKTSSGSAAKPSRAATPSGAVTKSSGSLPSSSPFVPAKPSGSPATRLARQLKEGRTVLLLFWNPHSSTDVTVRKQVQDVARSLGHKVAASYAKASEVGTFGTVTRDITVNETPTLLVIGKQGLVTSIAGLTDAFSIEQAVREAG